jgi:hypothetical protein
MPEAKEIFRAWNGLKNVCLDPWAIHRTLSKMCNGDFGEVYAKAHLGISYPPPDLPDDQRDQWLADNPPTKEDELTRIAAWEILLPAIRAAFKMAPLNEETYEGADDMDCQDALYAYCAFAEKKNQSTATTPTSAPPSDTGLWRPAPATPPIDPMPQTLQNQQRGTATG